ncbi:hypothetical protein [Ferrovibrio sp.]|uniref:hypothetical protein n=1 Tax=Ferrovibrio sp. TaxID=1917215 RepID=UPI003D2B75F1
MTRVGGWVLGGLLLALGGCAEVSCMTAPDRNACYAAYDTYEGCKTAHAPLIRRVGEQPVTTCRRDPIQHCSRGRDGKRRCYTATYTETCATRWEPIYDFSQYNIGVRSCMAQSGQGGYTGRFTAWD